MKVLVTGASGFIGSHVVRTLRGAGHEVRVLRRPSSDLSRVRDLGVVEVAGDLLDASSLADAIDGCRVLFHVGALYSLSWRDRKAILRTNVDGTRMVLDAAVKKGVERVVYTSSVATIGLRSDGAPSIETDYGEPGRFTGAYKLSKWLAEQEAMQFCRNGLDLVVVNPSTPIGWGDARPTPTGSIILNFLRRQMPGIVDTGLNLVDVEDVAAGHLLALEKGRSGERYILGNRNMTLAELFGELHEVTGLPAPIIKVPAWIGVVAAAVDEFVISPLLRREPIAPLAGAMLARKKMYFDGSKAASELGMPQTPVRRALEKAVAWFRAGGYLEPRMVVAGEGRA